MKSILLIPFLLLGIFSKGNSISKGNLLNEKGSIIITIKNIKAVDGAIKLALYNKAEGFLGEGSFLTSNETVAGKDEVTIRLDHIPFGTYAISLYHDENGNGELDKFLGFIPKEPYGFSNDARGSMGPPTYDQSKFDLKESELKMTITIDK
ncbi:MAG: DUF2141 domain-containing protein [Bacteroidota bacterium]|nr:DUF2141 domain-containing protein [Bacteroidota bacterium]